MPAYEELVRFKTKTILTGVMLVLVAHFLVPQLTDLPTVVDNVKDADWLWAAPLVTASVITYLGATLCLMGAVPNRLPTVPTFLAQFAASFTSKLAPAAVGGMALNVRYLQKAGVPSAIAATGIGLDALGGFVTHVILLALFLVWAGRSAFGTFHLPNPEALLAGAGVVLLLAIVVLAVPWVRHVLATKLVPILKRATHGVNVVLHSPTKLLLLLGGSTIVTVNYLTCLYFSVRAFGGDLRYAQVGAIYLAGAAVATAAPTPGGLGAIEAALIGGLVAAGLDNTVAVPAVFLYRLGTFWLPILPGWLSLAWLRRAKYV